MLQFTTLLTKYLQIAYSPALFTTTRAYLHDLRFTPSQQSAPYQCPKSTGYTL